MSIKIIFNFLAVLNLHCCASFSLVVLSGGYSLLWVSHCSGFSCCRAWALETQASVVAVLGLWSTGLVVGAHGLSCSMLQGGDLP